MFQTAQLWHVLFVRHVCIFFFMVEVKSMNITVALWPFTNGQQQARFPGPRQLFGSVGICQVPSFISSLHEFSLQLAMSPVLWAPRDVRSYLS